MLKHAFEDAFTQKNRAVRARYLEEMNPEQQSLMAENFRGFLANACERDNQRWFDQQRAKILANIAA